MAAPSYTIRIGGRERERANLIPLRNTCRLLHHDTLRKKRGYICIRSQCDSPKLLDV